MTTPQHPAYMIVRTGPTAEDVIAEFAIALPAEGMRWPVPIDPWTLDRIDGVLYVDLYPIAPARVDQDPAAATIPVADHHHHHDGGLPCTDVHSEIFPNVVGLRATERSLQWTTPVPPAVVLPSWAHCPRCGAHYPDSHRGPCIGLDPASFSTADGALDSPRAEAFRRDVRHPSPVLASDPWKDQHPAPHPYNQYGGCACVIVGCCVASRDTSDPESGLICIHPDCEQECETVGRLGSPEAARAEYEAGEGAGRYRERLNAEADHG